MRGGRYLRKGPAHAALNQIKSTLPQIYKAYRLDVQFENLRWLGWEIMRARRISGGYFVGGSALPCPALPPDTPLLPTYQQVFAGFVSMRGRSAVSDEALVIVSVKGRTLFSDFHIAWYQDLHVTRIHAMVGGQIAPPRVLIAGRSRRAKTLPRLPSIFIGKLIIRIRLRPFRLYTYDARLAIFPTGTGALSSIFS